MTEAVVLLTLKSDLQGQTEVEPAHLKGQRRQTYPTLDMLEEQQELQCGK